MNASELSEPVDEESFRETLEAAVAAADRNGVDVERDWRCQTSGSGPDWAVTVVPFEPQDGQTERAPPR